MTVAKIIVAIAVFCGAGLGQPATRDEAGAKAQGGASSPVPLPSTTPAPAVRFQTVDIFVDPGDRPLAAYQFTLRSGTRNALLAGLEGGEHAAFGKPPYYDNKALIDEQVIVAAFSTDEQLPHGRTRVARLHVQVTGDQDPQYEVTLQTSAGPDGKAMEAKVSVEAK
jgi:hypothetical protein